MPRCQPLQLLPAIQQWGLAEQWELLAEVGAAGKANWCPALHSWWLEDISHEQAEVGGGAGRWINMLGWSR